MNMRQALTGCRELAICLCGQQYHTLFWRSSSQFSMAVPPQTHMRTGCHPKTETHSAGTVCPASPASVTNAQRCNTVSAPISDMCRCPCQIRCLVSYALVDCVKVTENRSQACRPYEKSLDANASCIAHNLQPTRPSAHNSNPGCLLPHSVMAMRTAHAHDVVPLRVTIP
jgi:hypothetical protein